MSASTWFLSGVLSAGYSVAALFFLRFWRDSRDRLFLFFAIAFAILAFQRTLLTFVQPVEVMYALRLIAFVLIIVAIIEKNRRPPDR